MDNPKATLSTILETESIAQLESYDTYSSVTLWVLAGGVIIGVLVIGIVCAVCTILNRRYALQHPKERKFIPISEKHYHSPSPSSSTHSRNNDTHRDSLKEIGDNCGWCPTPSAVQVVRTSQGGTKNQLLDSSCHVLIPNLLSGASVESDNSGVFMGDPSRPESTMWEINEETPLPPSYTKRSGSQKSLSRDESLRPSVQIQIQSAEISMKYASHSHKSSAHAHPLLHPNFHSQSKDEDPSEMDDSALISENQNPHEFHIQVTPSLTSPETATTLEHDSAMGTATGSEVFSPYDPCRALWDLRSALENRVSPGESQLLMSISDRSDDGGETVIRVSSTAIDQEDVYLRSMDINLPASMLTSLTSFESNTPSDESFDATSCATALEAIFDEPSDLPLTSQPGKSAGASSTHLIPPVYRRRKQQQNQKLTSHQKRQSFKKARHLAAGHAVATKTPSAPIPAASSGPKAESKEEYRPISPSRLIQMKNDSGYKSQSFDATNSCGAPHNSQIHSFKSVPVLSMVHENSQSGSGCNSPIVDETVNRETQLNVPNSSILFSTSSEIEEIADCLSLTSSMEMDHQIPLLKTHPASPTSPSTSRDWSIDAKSDRLFREFSRTAPLTGSPLASRKHRGLRSKLQVRPYSPSSSHGGTPAQASIEETEEEQDSSLASTCTTIRVLEKPENQTPDFIFCSTREQVFTHISRRSKSPELRHVPIIKLPDQESDEV